MRFKFIAPLFGSLVWVFVGDSEKDKFIKECKKIYGVDISFRSEGGLCHGSYIWIKSSDLGYLTHEISHFADNCIEHIGVNDTSGEVRAYLMGWAVDTIWNRISKNE